MTAEATAELAVSQAPAKPRAERAFDVLFAVSALSWAVLGWTASASGPSATRCAISALHAMVAYTVLRRGAADRHPSPAAVAASVPALVMSALALRLAAPLSTWPLEAELLFVSGAGVAIYAFLKLGRSFSVLPARRAVVVHGPYRWLRYPAYAGELLMVLACVVSRPALATLLLLLLAPSLILLRIRAEERLLLQTDAYRRYARRTPWRLVPGVW